MTSAEYAEKLLDASYAWPGGYPISAIMADGEVLCPDCVKANIGQIKVAEEYCDTQWQIVGLDILWEGDIRCAHCDKNVTAYGDTDVTDEQ